MDPFARRTSEDRVAIRMQALRGPARARAGRDRQVSRRLPTTGLPPAADRGNLPTVTECAAGNPERSSPGHADRLPAYLNVKVEERDAKRPMQESWPLQAEATEDTVAGLAGHDRGRLVMACGTDKTVTALRIAEQAADNGQRGSSPAPTVAPVSQARRVWCGRRRASLNASLCVRNRPPTDATRTRKSECPSMNVRPPRVRRRPPVHSTARAQPAP